MEPERERLCRGLGFAGLAQLHEAVVHAIKGDIDSLLRKQLDAEALEHLGYTREGMRRLGCTGAQLEQLGYGAAQPPARGKADEDPPKVHHDVTFVRGLLEKETPHGRLKDLGVTAQHCRIAGADVTLLERLGFPLSELVRVYPMHEIKRVGHGARDLSQFFGDDELKAAGFSAVEMRLAGRTVQQLLRLGYNENHIRTAGYSINELSLAGLTRQTRDFVKGM
jgi:intracellular multiplication protein IcmE